MCWQRKRNDVVKLLLPPLLIHRKRRLQQVGRHWSPGWAMLSSSGKACNNNNNGYAPFEYQPTLAECVAKCESRGCKAFTYFSQQSTDPTERGYCTTVTGDCKEYTHPRCGNGLCQIYVKATKSPATSPPPPLPPPLPPPPPPRAPGFAAEYSW